MLGLKDLDGYRICVSYFRTGESGDPKGEELYLAYLAKEDRDIESRLHDYVLEKRDQLTDLSILYWYPIAFGGSVNDAVGRIEKKLSYVPIEDKHEYLLAVADVLDGIVDNRKVQVYLSYKGQVRKMRKEAAQLATVIGLADKVTVTVTAKLSEADVKDLTAVGEALDNAEL